MSIFNVTEERKDSSICGGGGEIDDESSFSGAQNANEPYK